MRRFNLEDVFQLRNLDIVITGRMVEGEIRVNDLIILPDGNYLKVDKIEMFRKSFSIARVGDNIGILVTSGSCEPTKEYLKSILKSFLEIIDISEFREQKLNQLGI
jgi:translation elongation factor EF-Tu-like GTPase